MRYWLMKGNPKWYSWEQELIPAKLEKWYPTLVPKEFLPNNRLFFWESSPKCRVVGLGRVASRFVRHSADGTHVGTVRYLTRRLTSMPGTDLIRAIADLRDALFLKPGPKHTIFPLTDREASALYRIVASENPEWDIWEDMSGTLHIEEMATSVREGGSRLLMHTLIERRNRSIIERKKQAFRAKHGHLFCECCNADLMAIYGPEAKDLCEVHHRRLLSAATKGVRTGLDDLAVLCPNCHRVIHRFDPMITVEVLAKRIKRANRVAKGN